MDSYDILVISLGVLLGLFLLVSIIFSVVLLQIVLRIKAATDKAKIVADNLSGFTSQFKTVGKVTALSSLFRFATKSVKQKKSKRK